MDNCSCAGASLQTELRALRSNEGVALVQVRERRQS